MVQGGKLATAAAGVINIPGVHGIEVVDVEADGKVFTHSSFKGEGQWIRSVHY